MPHGDSELTDAFAEGTVHPTALQLVGSGYKQHGCMSTVAFLVESHLSAYAERPSAHMNGSMHVLAPGPELSMHVQTC